MVKNSIRALLADQMATVPPVLTADLSGKTVLVTGAWWASSRGYVSWTGEVCTAEGFDPLPSYEELVTDYGKSPYCARLVRGETWF